MKCTHLHSMTALNGWSAGQTGMVPRGTRCFVPAEQLSAIRARHPAERPREAPGHWLVRSKTFRAYKNQRRRMSAVERTPNAHQASFFRAPAGRPQVRRRPAPYSPIGSANRSPTATSRASANLMSVPKVAFTSPFSTLANSCQHTPAIALKQVFESPCALRRDSTFRPTRPVSFRTCRTTSRTPHAKTPFLAG